MADPSPFVRADVRENMAILLVSRATYAAIRLLGTTVPASVASDNFDSHSQISFYPEKGKDGIVALVVVINPSDRKSSVSHIPFFAKIIWKETDGVTHPFIDLDQPWISGYRIGHVGDDYIQVTLPNGKRFSTDTIRSRKYAVVSNGDLLCRYLWGAAKAIDVLHAAVEEKLEPTLRQRLDDLTREHRILLARRAQEEVDIEREVNRTLRMIEESIRLNQELARKDKLHVDMAGRYQEVSKQHLVALGFFLKYRWMSKLSVLRLPFFVGFAAAERSLTRPAPKETAANA